MIGRRHSLQMGTLIFSSGVWSHKTITPFERPKALAGRSSLTDAEVGPLKSGAAQLFARGGDVAAGDELFLALLANPNDYIHPDAVGCLRSGLVRVITL